MDELIGCKNEGREGWRDGCWVGGLMDELGIDGWMDKLIGWKNEGMDGWMN